MDRKKVQFATLFQILELSSCPILEHKKRKALYSFIGMFKNFKVHWSNSSSWVMVQFMYAHVTNAIIVILSIVNYVAFTCDEVNIKDIGSCIFINAYMMQNWEKVPMMTSFQRVFDGARANNLIHVNMEAMPKGGGLILAFIT